MAKKITETGNNSLNVATITDDVVSGFVENYGGISEILISMGVATKEEIIEAEDRYNAVYMGEYSSKPFWEFLYESKVCKESDVVLALGKQSNEEVVFLDDKVQYNIDSEILGKFGDDFFAENIVLPVKIDNESLFLISDPYNCSLIDKIKNSGYEHKLTTKTSIASLLDSCGLKTEIDIDSEKSVKIKLEKIIETAIKKDASDIHITPSNQGTVFSFRIEGELKREDVWSKALHNNLVNRICVLAKTEHDKKNTIQEAGHFTWNAHGEIYNARVTMVPTICGTFIEIRLHNPAKKINLAALGYEKEEIAELKYLMEHKAGLILITGSTGSGKTTTMYGMLGFESSAGKNIMSAEDPPEVYLPYVKQVEVTEGMSFADILRAILRVDPDLIVLGEVRDNEVAHECFNMANIGHKILATLHTKDPASALMRLADLGIDRYKLPSLIGVISQDLLRVLCPHCKQSIKIDFSTREPYLEVIRESLVEMPNFYEPRPNGCPRCKNKGFTGRTVVSDIVRFDNRIATLDVASEKYYSYINDMTIFSKRNKIINLLKKGDISISSVKPILIDMARTIGHSQRRRDG